MDSSRALADHAAPRIKPALHVSCATLSTADIAARMDVIDRHLRSVFAAAHGVTPQRYLTT